MLNRNNYNLIHVYANIINFNKSVIDLLYNI